MSKPKKIIGQSISWTQTKYFIFEKILAYQNPAIYYNQGQHIAIKLGLSQEYQTLENKCKLLYWNLKEKYNLKRCRKRN